MMPKIGVPYANAPVDLDAVFGRSAPKIFEIGCGMGETSYAISAANPQNDYLGLEVTTPGRRQPVQAGRRGRHQQPAHLPARCGGSAARHDRPGNAVRRYIFFPIPGRRRAITKRRLIQPPLVATLVSKLTPGGYIHCATDWANYAEQMLEVLSAEPGLQNTADGYARARITARSPKFEQRGLRLGHGVWDLVSENADYCRRKLTGRIIWRTVAPAAGLMAHAALTAALSRDCVAAGGGDLHVGDAAVLGQHEDDANLAFEIAGDRFRRIEGCVRRAFAAPPTCFFSGFRLGRRARHGAWPSGGSGVSGDLTSRGCSGSGSRCILEQRFRRWCRRCRNSQDDLQRRCRGRRAGFLEGAGAKHGRMQQQ